MKLKIAESTICYIVSMAICSCSGSSGEYRGALLEIPDTVSPKILNSELIVSSDTIIHIEQIRIYGKYILGMSGYDTEALFKIFSTNGEYISDFGKIGNGADEFTQGVVPTCQYNEESIYLQDVNKCCLYVIDLSESIRNHRTVCKNRYKTKPMTINICNVGDSMLVYEYTSAHEYKLKQELYNGIEVFEPISLNEPVENLFASCYGKMVFDPLQKTVVKASVFEDRILFLNYEDLTRRTYCHSSDNNGKDWIYYGAITANDNNIYVLYMNQSAEDSFEVEKSMTIHVFDWSGNYRNTLRTEEYIKDISVDKDDNCIYGLDTEGNIYKYNLKQK